MRKKLKIVLIIFLAVTDGTSLKSSLKVILDLLSKTLSYKTLRYELTFLWKIEIIK